MPLFLFVMFFSMFQLLGAMTLEEKVGQLMIIHFNGEAVNDEAKRLIQEAHTGGFIYYNWANGLDSPEQVRRLSKELQALSRTPLWICIDQEGGKVRRLDKGFPYLPGNRELVEKKDPHKAEKWGYDYGLILKDLGINMNLAPVVDVSAHPETSYISSRTYGETPEIVVQYGKKAVAGYRKAGVVSVLKHFPGYGSVVIDPHADLPIVMKSRSELEAVDLVPFKELAKEADALMTAHILVPALDRINCATVSKEIIEGVLRHEMGFEGLVITDSLVMQGLLNHCSSLEEACIQAVNAGCDLLILGGKQLLDHKNGFELSVDGNLRIHRALVDGVKQGRITMERLDEAVGRSLMLKERYCAGTVLAPCKLNGK